MKTRYARRGIMMVMVVMVMTLVGAFMALLTSHAQYLYRQRQAQAIRVVARQLAESGAAYARSHAALWATTRPAQPIELDVRSLVASPLHGTVHVRFDEEKGVKVCRISGQSTWHAYTASHELTLSLPAP